MVFVNLLVRQIMCSQLAFVCNEMVVGDGDDERDWVGGRGRGESRKVP